MLTLAHYLMELPAKWDAILNGLSSLEITLITLVVILIAWVIYQRAIIHNKYDQQTVEIAKALNRALVGLYYERRPLTEKDLRWVMNKSEHLLKRYGFKSHTLKNTTPKKGEEVL